MNYAVTYNKELYPALKKCPDKRMIGHSYVYIPTNLLTQAEGLTPGDDVTLEEAPLKGDIICKVKKTYGSGTSFLVFWKDLVRL